MKGFAPSTELRTNAFVENPSVMLVIRIIFSRGTGISKNLVNYFTLLFFLHDSFPVIGVEISDNVAKLGIGISRYSRNVGEMVYHSSGCKSFL